jgi:hypothetical protein
MDQALFLQSLQQGVQQRESILRVELNMSIDTFQIPSKTLNSNQDSPLSTKIIIPAKKTPNNNSPNK